MSETTILDLDAMMDMEMDKVETLPDFINPPAGTYMLSVNDCKFEKYTTKPKDGKKPEDLARFKIVYTVDKTLEVGNSADLPVKDGSLFTESFMATEDGLKYFKRQAMNIMNVSDLAGATVKDVIDGLKGNAFKAAITIQKTPGKEAGTTYENVRVRPVHEAA